MTVPLPTVVAAAGALRSGRITPAALLEECLARVAALDDALLAFVHLNPAARDEAARAGAEIAAGRWRGPLHGVPVAVKDNMLTAGMPTRAGTEAPGLHLPDEDAGLVAELRRAGAVLVGKTRTHEFAWGTVTPPARNPWDTARVPGGSSGGSAAALSAGMCLAATGSDTGGSIRIPASLCGVVGLKPTFGRVGRHGVVPHSWSLDTAGPLAASVEDAALLLDAMAGHDPRDPGSADAPPPEATRRLDAGLAGLTLGVCRDHFFERNQPDVDAAVEGAIRLCAAEGARVVEFRLPNLAHGLGAIFAIELASSTAWHDAALRRGSTAAYQPDVRDLVELGRLVTGADYLRAEQYRRVLIEDFARVMAEVDAVLAPTTPLTAWPSGIWEVEVGAGPESVLAASWRLTYPFNLTGMPAVSIPCGLDRSGLPIGLQIAGRPFEEALVLRVARACERRLGGPLRPPLWVAEASA